MRPSRRLFVQRLSFFGGGSVLLGCKEAPTKAKAAPKPEAPLTSSHATFTDEEWDTLCAACERVLPKDEDPGALEAGVPEYIDRMLQSPQLEKMKKDFVPGVAAIKRRSERMFKVPFAKATPAQQDELLAIFRDSPEKSGEARWFDMLMVLSLEGFLGDPSYGGNRDKVGWKLVGFDLVGGRAMAPGEGYDGLKHLHGARCGGGKGC